MSLPEAGLFGLGLALALLWWNWAAWILRKRGPAAVEVWLLMVEPPRERAEQRRDSLHLKAAVEPLDRASIMTMEKVWPSHYTHSQDFTGRKKEKYFLWKVNHLPIQTNSTVSPAVSEHAFDFRDLSGKNLKSYFLWIDFITKMQYMPLNQLTRYSKLLPTLHCVISW